MTDQDKARYERARKRVKQIKEFYGHLFIYVAVIGFLFVINLMTTRDFLWVIFPAGGWGLGLIAHAMETFDFGLGRDWEDRKIRELMAREAETEAAYTGTKPKRMIQEDFFEEEAGESGERLRNQDLSR